MRLLFAGVCLAAITRLFSQLGGSGWIGPALFGAFVALAGARNGGRGQLLPALRAPTEAAVATVVGWTGLLTFAAAGIRFAPLAAALGSLARVRGAASTLVVVALAVTTVLIGAVLAWCVSILTEAAVRGYRRLVGSPTATAASGRVTLSATPTPAPPGAPDRAPAARIP